MHTRLLVLVAATLAVALSPGQAAAHALTLVVKFPPDSPDVTVETGFDDDTPAEGAKVVVTAADGSVVAEGKTNEKGVYKFAKPKPGRYTATVESIGHRDSVEFEVAGTAEEYRGWRLDPVLGLAIGVVGLLGGSVGYWWLRRKSV